MLMTGRNTNLIMIIKQSPIFANLKKKLHNNQLTCLDKAIEEIKANFEIGKLKTGDLKNIRVYEFKMIRERWKLAYQLTNNNELILLILFGSHENFYDTLKRLLRNTNL